jgi:regulator of nucleoside diphosphate kinase
MNHLRSVVISAGDRARIQSCVEKVMPDSAELLLDELDTARIVPDGQLPADVVSMGSEVKFRDLLTGETSVCTLVFPHQADVARQHISILAPVGAALIGLRCGETIEWPMPGGKVRKLEVLEVQQAPRP